MRSRRTAWWMAVLFTGGFLSPAARGEKFTLAVIPDVQPECYEHDTARFRNRLQWLVNNRAVLNLKMVLQVGDLMDINLESLYARMSEAMRILDEAGIPYATCLGNHDTAAVREDSGSAAPGNVNANLRNTARYNAHFPLARFRALGGTYEAGKIDNAFHTFSAGGLDWVVVNLELWARTGAVDWAKSVVAGHPNHNVIFLTHSHMNGQGDIGRSNGGYGDNSPQYVFDQVMKPHANVRMVLSGHVGIHAHRADTGANGNAIHQFLQCYHDHATNPVRLLEIDTAAGTMTSRVHCPSIGRDKVDGSTRTITGLTWVRPAVRPAAPIPPAMPRGIAGAGRVRPTERPVDASGPGAVLPPLAWAPLDEEWLAGAEAAVGAGQGAAAREILQQLAASSDSPAVRSLAGRRLVALNR